MEDRKSALPSILYLLSSILLVVPTTAHAAWFDAAWPYRRTLDVTWDAEHASGDELAYTEFYSAGHAKPNGEDVRVATDEGKLVASRVLMTGPGDQVRVVFALAKGVRKYAVYFGHPEPPAAKKELEEGVARSGLLMEMKTLSGVVHASNFKEIEQAWNNAKTIVGRTMIPTVFLGVNPFGEQRETISKLSGSIFAPIDGDYLFAAAADDRGAVFVDGQGVVFAPDCPGDVRYQGKINLKRGRHEFVFYQLNFGGESRFSVAWKKPATNNFEVIGRESFGVVPRAVAGGLEEKGKTLTADFKAEYLGECFYNDHYSHRYRFTIQQPKATAPAGVEWLFGDGQTSTAKEVEHVFLASGVYPIRLTMRIGSNSDTQTTHFVVSRDFERITNPPLDEPPVQAKIVQGYDISKMPLAWLTWGATLQQRAKQPDAALAILKRLVEEPTVPDSDAALDVLSETTRDLITKRRGDEILPLWDRIPPGSNLNPKAAKSYVQFLLWWSGDFEKALKVLEPYAKSDDKLMKRLYGQALVFTNHADKGAEMLRSVGGDGEPERRVVMSGAMARTIEHCIDQKDWEAGEEVWEKWQTRYPADFMEGYSVLLRTRLMEVRNDGPAAARVAEAFALSVPKSSYAPQLLDRASKLYERIDSRKSSWLRATLREKYPEDPLSQ